MPISYGIPLKPLWRDALLSHVRHFMVLERKYIFLFHNKQSRIKSPNKPFSLSKKDDMQDNPTLSASWL